MKQHIQAAIALAAIGLTAGVARADLTINGAVGLPLNPTAQIPAEGGARIQGNYFDHGDAGALGIKQYGVYGAARVADNFEVSGGFEKLDTNPDSAIAKSGVALGAKYLFSREGDPAGVRLAVGAGYSRALLKNTHAYVVATKYLGQLTEGRTPITGHLGLRYDKFKDAGDSDKASIFAGVEVPVTATGEFQVVGEIGSKNVDGAGAKMPYSASVRYRPQGQPFGASIGIQRQGLTGDSGLFAQIGYTFNTK